MDITQPQKRKHLLLLNRIMRAELKKDIIPVPSKLTEEEVNKYFERLFIKITKGSDDYYIPIKSKVELKIDEELFKGLIKKKKTLAQRTEEKKDEKAMMKEKEKEMTKTIALSAYKKFEKEFVEPYVNKKRANEDFKKEEEMMIKKYIKLGVPVKQIIKKELPKTWDRLLNPAYEQEIKRKEGLVEEEMKLKDMIKKEAKNK